MNKLQNHTNQSAAADDGDAMSDCVIPEDIIFFSILTRLPVKSLLRFKSVCKAWLKLFATPTFIKLHRRQFSDDRNFTIHSLYKTLCAHTRPWYIKAMSDNKSTDLDYLFVEIFNLMDFLGCFICMAYPPPRQGFILWNPSTRMSKFTRLPENEIDIEKTETVLLEFGYDEGEDDFKVTRVSYFFDSQFPDVVEVYSAKLDSWKTIKHDDFRFNLKNSNIYGCLQLQCYTERGKITVLCIDGKLFALEDWSRSVKEIDFVDEYQLESFANYHGYTESVYEYTQSLVGFDGMEPVTFFEEEEDEEDDDGDGAAKAPADVAGFFWSYFQIDRFVNF